uniref:Transporter n=1 Tax=Ciona savignyi TaxID=51511 RepID=H2YE65_CIOSA
RPAWDNQVQFLLACIAYAVGLGNIWRFPYLAQTYGGGAFLIPYILMLVFEGVPLFLLELAVGQRLRQGSIGAWTKFHPYLGGIGIGSMVVSFMVGLYYNTIIAWCFWYICNSFTVLRWVENNSCKTVLLDNPRLSVSYSSVEVIGRVVRYIYRLDPLPYAKCPLTDNNTAYVEECQNSGVTDYFWYRDTLNISPSIDDTGGIVWWVLICLILAWTLIWVTMIKGIESSGKLSYVTPHGAIAFYTPFKKPGIKWWFKGVKLFFDLQAMYVTATFPYLVLFIFLVRGLTLRGSGEGVTFLFTPDVSVLSNPQVWLDAATQIFFSLGLGFGGVIAFASYNPKKQNCQRDALIIALTNSFTSIFASIVIFAILGYRATLKALPSQLKASQGTGLAFIVFTEAIINMPGSPVWSVLFFMMLLSLGLGSMFGTVEGVVTPLFDLGLKVPKPILTGLFYRSGIICLISCAIGLIFCTRAGNYWVDIFNNYAGSIPLLVIAFFEITVISWAYGLKKYSIIWLVILSVNFYSTRFDEDLEWMFGKPDSIATWILYYYFRSCWFIISPVILLVVIIKVNFMNGKEPEGILVDKEKGFKNMCRDLLTWERFEERPQWDNKAQFLLTCIGFAVGLGNVWRFPYQLQSNGGGLGICSLFVSFLVGMYYNTIIAWCLWYLCNSFQEPLPWNECPPNANLTAPVQECALSSATEYYWYRKTLNITPSITESGGIQVHILACIILAWLIVTACVIKGIASSGKVVYFTATFPYVVMFCFLVRGLTLPGSSTGLSYLFTPKVKARFIDPQIWLTAATQIFFSLSLAFGGMIAFSSYNPRDSDVEANTYIVAVTNSLTSLLATVVIFSVLGFKATVDFESCGASGTGLAFIVFAEAILRMPGSPFWSVLFFLMLLTLGLDSMFGNIE